MPGKNPPRVWGLKDIQALLDVLAGKEITEFEMEQQGVKIRVKRGNTDAANLVMPEATFAPAAPPAAPGVQPPSTSAMLSPAIPTATEPTGEATEGLYIQKSPIVGTFYASPAPNAPPFVKPGDIVQAGQVLCIIEAMKLMNELEAEVAGEIVRVYVETGQPVEYGQSLFAIKPSHKK
jgi:acetyl-CoA carboxylase biotin carboxyl carrier protein